MEWCKILLHNKKAVKRRVDSEICFRELYLVKMSTKVTIEDGLGAV